MRLPMKASIGIRAVEMDDLVRSGVRCDVTDLHKPRED